jgi:hypothetical protein
MSFFQTIVRSFSTDEGTNEGKNDKIEEKVFIHNAVENGNGTNKDIPGYCGTPTKVREEVYCIREANLAL